MGFVTVPKSDVLAVLRKHGVDVQEASGITTLKKGTVVERHRLPDQLVTKHLHRFAHKFGIAVHLLFNISNKAAATASALRR